MPLTRASVPPPPAPADTLGTMVRFLVLYELNDPAEFDRHYRPYYPVVELDRDTMDDLTAAVPPHRQATDDVVLAPTGVRTMV